MDLNELTAALGVIHAQIRQGAQEPGFDTRIALFNLASDLRLLSANASQATRTFNPNLRGTVLQLAHYIKAHPLTEPATASTINRNAQKALKRYRAFSTSDLKEALQLCGYMDLVTAAGTVWYPAPDYPPPRT